MRALFWSLVVIAVLAVGADRLGDYAAERVVASRVQSSQGLAHTPEVTIAGFPFLTQLARQHFDRVTATTTDVTVGQGQRRVVLSKVAITFADVTTNRDFSRFEAATGKARATVSYPELSKVLGITTTYAGKGRVKASKKFTVLGRTLAPSITVKPRLLDGALGFTNATLDGSLPDPVAEVLRAVFDVDLPLSGVPFDIKATSLAADAQGLQLRLAGKNLSYTE